jgi:hypothetical protein
MRLPQYCSRQDFEKKSFSNAARSKTNCERIKLGIAQLQLDTANCQIRVQRKTTKGVQVELAPAETELKTAGVAVRTRDAERAVGHNCMHIKTSTSSSISRVVST